MLSGHRDGAKAFPSFNEIRKGCFRLKESPQFHSGTAGSAVTIWDAVTFQERVSFFAESGPVRKLLFSPDGTLLVALVFQGMFGGFPGGLVIWDIPRGTQKVVESFAGKHFCAAAFLPSGKILALLNVQGSLQFWDLNTLQLTSERTVPLENEPWSIDVARDSKTVAVGLKSGTITIYESDSEQVTRLGAHQAAVLSVHFHPDGRQLATAAADGTVRLWDLRNRKESRLLKGHRDQVQEVKFSPRGDELVSASHDRTVRFWSLHLDEADVLHGHTNEVTCLDFSPDAKLLATGSQDRTVRVWDLNSGTHRILMLSNAVRSVAFSPDGRYLAAGSVDGTTVWPVPRWDESTVLPRSYPRSTSGIRTGLSQLPEVTCLRFSRDGKSLFVAEWSLTQVWQVGDWRSRTNLVWSPGPVVLATSPEGQFLATGGGFGFGFQLWNTKTWRPLDRPSTLPSNFGAVTALAFTRDGRQLIVGTQDATLSLWPVEQSEPAQFLQGQVGEVRAMAISPDGNTLAVSNTSGGIKLWNLATRKELFTLVGHRETVSCLAFSADGRLLASGSTDSTIRLWRASPTPVPRIAGTAN